MPEIEKELLTFPYGKHDDQVDSISQALAFILELLRWPWTPAVPLLFQSAKEVTRFVVGGVPSGAAVKSIWPSLLRYL